MIQVILMGLLSFATALLNLLLKPINDIIVQQVPQINTLLNYVSNLCDTASTYFGWIRDSLFIDTEVMAFIIVVVGIRLTIPLLVSTIKLVAKWWDTIIA